ncbi:OmpA family protein [Rhodoferax sp. GW822-FHT02A01]|uniref:OmpA family protein n=1 Tax=Rhodoferax sp. GW822-FHT02A01 TaxID=3141537 RepID=UPI00315CB33A
MSAIRSLLICTLLALSGAAFAQATTPSTEQMIQQLRTPPRLRSLRNLTVEAVPADAGGSAVQATGVAQAQERPSLSLSIQFDFDSSRIRAESLAALSNLASALSSDALLNSRFVIEGHTDAKGNAEYNRKLSDQRAAAVRDLLVSKGIAADRLVAVGKGSSEPANPQVPLAAENRRVKIVNLD